MPNVPGSTTTRRVTRNRLPRTRTYNRRIKRIYRRGKGKKKTTVNKRAILSLGRSIRALKQQSYGFKQWDTQFLRISSNIAGQFPLRDQPVAWLVNSLYPNAAQGAVYRGGIDPTGVPTGAPIGGTVFWTKQTFDPTIGNEFQWIPAANQSSVSATQYLPLESKYTFNIRASLSAIQAPVTFRITMFMLRNQREGQGPGISMGLPIYLGSYGRMCVNDLRSKNYFSRIRHRVLWDRTITFNPSVATAGEVNTLNMQKTLKHTVRFPNKPIRMNTQLIPAGDQTLISNLPEDQLVWCMISCSEFALPASSFTFDIARVNSWRDMHGLTTL